ncbi:MAG TPA: transglutaminase-like domain-containing protein [Gemmatimonadota bacterium]|nr:transglutaminase-like domain-containing protein [Gemmatimonadota bacterium]
MARVLTPQDIHALIHLLGDDDDWIKQQARSALRAAGELTTPYLETASVGDDEPEIRSESSALLEDIHFDDIERRWVALQATVEGEALEEGAFLLERMILPDRARHVEIARDELRELTAGALEAVPEHAPLEERVDSLRSYVHETCRFHGNTEDYYDPDNSFFSSVLIRRTGIPITLALVYLTIGRRIGVPLVGIGMPMHFLIGYRAASSYRYLDPFFGGREVSRGECLLLLERAGFDPAERYLRSAPVVGILERMARNLTVIYQNGARERELRLARRYVTMLTGEVA